MNTDNEELQVRTLGDGLICCATATVSGSRVRTSSKLNFPRNRKMRACTMREISACAEVDPLRKNGTQKTISHCKE